MCIQQRGFCTGFSPVSLIPGGVGVRGRRVTMLLILFPRMIAFHSVMRLYFNAKKSVLEK